MILQTYKALSDNGQINLVTKTNENISIRFPDKIIIINKTEVYAENGFHEESYPDLHIKWERLSDQSSDYVLSNVNNLFEEIEL